MFPLSEMDSNRPFCPKVNRHAPESSLSHTARRADVLRAKTADRNAASEYFEPSKTTDEQTSLDKAFDSTSVKDATFKLQKPTLPNASDVNTIEKSPQTQLTTINDKVDQSCKGQSPLEKDEDRVVLVDQDVNVSTKSVKPTTGDEPKKKLSFQEDTKLTADIQQILQSPFNQYLLLHPEVSHEHFKWIGRNLRVGSIEEVYRHPNLQEFLGIALEFAPETDDDIETDNAHVPDSRKAVLAETFILGGDDTISEVSIPGLTLKNEEDAEWESTVEAACETPPAELDLETLLEESEDADSISICLAFASHLSADELAEIVILGEGNVVRMLDIVSRLY